MQRSAIVMRCRLSSVCRLAYRGQTVGRIKTGRPRPWPHCVRWDPAPPPPMGHSPPIFGPYLLRPNGSMDEMMLITCCADYTVTIVVSSVVGAVALVALFVLFHFIR